MTAAIQALSTREKLNLIGEIWDSLAESPDQVAVTEGHLQIIHERRSAYNAESPKEPWPQLRERIESVG